MVRTLVQKINDRGYGGGWHAYLLEERAARNGRTMAEEFKSSIQDAVAFNVPAVAISSKGTKVTYQFLDDSTITI